MYANTGKQEVNIGAPGEFVLVANDVYFPTGERKPGEIIYHQNGGTSLAAPYVAGVCALLNSYFPYTKLNSNYALCYNKDGDTSTYNKTMFCLYTKNNKALSQKWVLESLSNDTLDGKTLKYAYATSTLDNAKLIYVGNSQYVVQKDGKIKKRRLWKSTETLMLIVRMLLRHLPMEMTIKNL